KDALKAEVLRLGEVNKKEVDDPDLVGEVLDEGQEPSSGTSIEAGQKVDVTVGKAPPKVAVTDYTGKSFQAAKAGLTAVGFQVERQDKDSDEPAGTVLSQDPSSGKHPEGTTITLPVSNRSQNSFTLPDLTGRSGEQAESALSAQAWRGDLGGRNQYV